MIILEVMLGKYRYNRIMKRLAEIRTKYNAKQSAIIMIASDYEIDLSSNSHMAGDKKMYREFVLQLDVIMNEDYMTGCYAKRYRDIKGSIRQLYENYKTIKRYVKKDTVTMEIYRECEDLLREVSENDY